MSQALSLPQSEDLRKRILIVSDSIRRCTGYSAVARNIIKNIYNLGKYKIAQLGLADIPVRSEFPIQYYSNVKSHRQCCGKGHVIEFVEENSDEVKYLDLCPFGTLNPNQTPCNKAINEDSDAYGYDSIYFVVEHFKPDIIIPINDLWGLYNIVHLKSNPKFKFLPYLAIDSECLFPSISAPSDRQGLPNINTLDVISKAHKAIVFTDWAKEVINRTARTITNKELNNLDVIPHGVDTSIWKPLPNRDFLRNKYFNLDANNKTFLLGSIARNQPRKRLDAIIQTLQLIKKSYPKLNVKCHFHCCLEDKIGWNLIWLAKYYDVEEMCIFDAKLKPGVGPSDQIMNEIANCYDAHISLSNSEGFCSFGDTRIVTQEGIKELKDLRANDIIISHIGKEQKVTTPMSREYNGTMIGFRYVGATSKVWFTPNHRLLVANNKLNKTWMPAEFVTKSHYLCFPKPKKHTVDTTINIKDMIEKYSTYKIMTENGLIYGCKNEKINKKSKPIPETMELDSKTAEFLGNYVAEGSHGESGITISINASGDEIIRNNTKEIATLFNLNYKRYVYNRNRENSTITSTTLANLFSSFGRKAHDKNIPIEIYNVLKNNQELCKSFLNGTIEGDGYCSEENGLVYTTVSEVLAYQIKYLFLTLGVYSKIYCTVRKTNRDSFVVQIQCKKYIDFCRTFINKLKNINHKVKTENTYVLEDDDYFYIPIKTIFEKEYSGLVYNISVEDDESYIAEGFAVHNCLPTLETMAAGVPNIALNYSAIGDWGKSAVYLIDPAAYEHEARTGFVKAVADIRKAAQAVKILADSSILRKEYSKKSLALANKLNWSKICSTYWEKMLDAIDTSDLDTNRWSSLKLDHRTFKWTSLPDEPTITDFELPIL